MPAIMVVMFILTGGTPTAIQGWSSLHACEAAQGAVQAAFTAHHGKTSYGSTIHTRCEQFDNKS
jgi:2-methylcitrate dehydratase PrpD